MLGKWWGNGSQSLDSEATIGWYGMVWYGMVWYCMAWYGIGMAWYGMAWGGIARRRTGQEEEEKNGAKVFKTRTQPKEGWKIKFSKTKTKREKQENENVVMIKNDSKDQKREST